MHFRAHIGAPRPLRRSADSQSLLTLVAALRGFEAVSAMKKNPESATIPIMTYTSQQGEVAYPTVASAVAAGVWNDVAQANNRVEITLLQSR